MKSLDCKSMKAAVLVSAVLFVTGALLQIPALTSFFGTKYLAVIVAFIGLAGMALALLLAVVIAIASLFPETRKRLKLCEH